MRPFTYNPELLAALPPEIAPTMKDAWAAFRFATNDKSNAEHRDYQQKAVDSVLAAWKDHRSCVVVLPFPSFKDVREWYAKGGLTKEKFETAAKTANWCLAPRA